MKHARDTEFEDNRMPEKASPSGPGKAEGETYENVRSGGPNNNTIGENGSADKGELAKFKALLAEVEFLCGLGLSPIPIYANGIKGREGKLRDKNPFGPGFQNRASSDFTAAKPWFEDAFDYMGVCPNVGLLNGAIIPARDGRPAGRLIIIDKDIKGPDGKPMTTAKARHDELALAIGCALPPTVMDMSPSGGGHEFYWCSEDAFAPLLGLSIDIGFLPGLDYPIQCLVAPSTGYAWHVCAAPGDIPFAEARAELIAFLAKGGRARADKKAGATADEGNDAPENQAKFIDYLANRAPEAVANAGKHRTMIRVANVGGDLNLTAMTTCELIFKHWNEQKCFPAYDFDRLLHHIETSRPSRASPIGSKTAEGVFDLSAEQIVELGETASIGEKVEAEHDKANAEYERAAAAVKAGAEPRYSEDPDAGLSGDGDGAGPGAASAVVGGIKKKVTTVEKLNSQFGLYSSPEGGDIGLRRVSFPTLG